MATIDHRHLPADLIDRHLAGLLPPDVATSVEASERTCDVCGKRAAEARRAAAHFLARNPPPLRAGDLQDRFGRARRRRMIVWAVPAFSAAALALLVARPRPAPDDDIIAKGPAQEPALDFSVDRPGSTSALPGGSGGAFRASDALHLQLQPGRFHGVHVFSVDASGRTEPLFDWSPAAGAPPPTLVLDGAPGTERIVALFHDLLDPASELPRMREVLARDLTGPGGPGLEAEPRWQPPGVRDVAVRSIVVRKEITPSQHGPLERP